MDTEADTAKETPAKLAEDQVQNTFEQEDENGVDKQETV